MKKLAAVLLLGLASLATAQQSVTINLVNGHAPVFLWVQQLQQTFIPAVDAALEGTGYTIEWNEFFGGSLAPVGGELEALEAGLADVGIVPTVFEPTNLPLQNVTYYTPFGATDPFVVADVVNEMHETIPALIEAWERFDLVYLGSGFSLDNYMLMTTFPVNALEDLRGRRIGAPGPAVNWLEGTGAVGVSGNLATYYNDIQTGVYEGVITFPSAAAPARLQEVAPYVTLLDFGSQYAGTLVANAHWFEAQPQEIQDALRAGAQAYGEAYAAALRERLEASIAALDEGGATITEAPPELKAAWANALPNIPVRWAEQLDAQGLPGSQVLQAYLDGIRAHGATLPRDWDLE
jgi:TRAP-type C4-dicarboxylate transport system substrate-binding protein